MTDSFEGSTAKPLAGTPGRLPPATRTRMETPLRIGFDMDGVLADLSSAYHRVEQGIFGSATDVPAHVPPQEEGAPTTPESATGDLRDAGRSAEEASAERREARRRQQVVWSAIIAQRDFWLSLAPLEPGAVARVHEMTLRHRWEVCFITQRPRTAGATVQRQTQRWLVEQGFDLPTVVVLAGARGAAAGVLQLTYHVDDSPQNCLDVLAESSARPILVVPGNDADTVTRARRLGIGTAPSLTDCLDILDRATSARDQPETLLAIAASVGWK